MVSFPLWKDALWLVRRYVTGWVGGIGGWVVAIDERVEERRHGIDLVFR
jgi:hypothetical protein